MIPLCKKYYAKFSKNLYLSIYSQFKLFITGLIIL